MALFFRWQRRPSAASGAIRASPARRNSAVSISPSPRIMITETPLRAVFEAELAGAFSRGLADGRVPTGYQ
jgi:hypothetical protein